MQGFGHLLFLQEHCCSNLIGQCYRAGGCQLAVLHPRKLVIYSISSLSSGQGVAAVQLNKVWEQGLQRSAANMVSGNFGGSTGAAAVVLPAFQVASGYKEREFLSQVLCTYASSPWMVSLAFMREKG